MSIAAVAGHLESLMDGIVHAITGYPPPPDDLDVPSFTRYCNIYGHTDKVDLDETGAISCPHGSLAESDASWSAWRKDFAANLLFRNELNRLDKLGLAALQSKEPAIP